MHTGKGVLVLRDGRRLPLSFQFANIFDEVRSGYLYLDTSRIDPVVYAGPMMLICEDQTEIEFVVGHFSDAYLAVSGRTAPSAAEAIVSSRRAQARKASGAWASAGRKSVMRCIATFLPLLIRTADNRSGLVPVELGCRHCIGVG